jgi:hypothetical protein
MRLTPLLVSLLYAATASAEIGFGFLGRQDPLPSTDDDLSVPGQNPLYYCSDPENDILTIEKVDLEPNPPEA